VSKRATDIKRERGEKREGGKEGGREKGNDRAIRLGLGTKARRAKKAQNGAGNALPGVSGRLF
jgi:hypothetical protein